MDRGHLVAAIRREPSKAPGRRPPAPRRGASGRPRRVTSRRRRYSTRHNGPSTLRPARRPPAGSPASASSGVAILRERRALVDRGWLPSDRNVDRQQCPSRGDQPGDGGDRVAAAAASGRACTVNDLDDQVERPEPGVRQVEQVADLEVDACVRVALACLLHRRRRDVEAGGREPQPREVRRVGAEAAADHHGASGRRRRARWRVPTPPAGPAGRCGPRASTTSPGDAGGVEPVEPGGRLSPHRSACGRELVGADVPVTHRDVPLDLGEPRRRAARRTASASRRAGSSCRRR